MSETNEIVHCPECGHRGFLHSALHNKGTCGAGSCGCIRTYESLVGEKEKDMATELQLLLVDYVHCCTVQGEKGQWTYTFENGERLVLENGAVEVIYKTFAELREAIDGVKPVPRIERYDLSANEDYILICEPYARHTGTTTGRRVISREELDALSELAGKPLPIWAGGGTWEELGHIDDDVYNNTDLRVWRYKRNENL